MSDWGCNPRQGWANGPWAGIGYGHQYEWMGGVPGFFPPPEGMEWRELPPAAAFPPWYEVGAGCPCGGCHTSGGFYDGGFPGWDGQGWAGSYQQQQPVYDGGVPGINIRNPQGGIGMEPERNYIFPEDNCAINVINTAEPPWRYEDPGQLQFKAFYGGCNMTIKELMKRFGCNNEDAAKNVIHECTPGGNGKWYKGISLKGDNKDMMKKSLNDVGWRKNRNGVDDDVVWLYLTKD